MTHWVPAGPERQVFSVLPPSFCMNSGLLRLRGGHRKSGFKKFKAANPGMKVAKRIHSMSRPRLQKRALERFDMRKEKLKALARSLNVTIPAEEEEEVEIEKEDKKERKLREPRLFERTVEDVMKGVHECKILHPEIFEEEQRMRLDDAAQHQVSLPSRDTKQSGTNLPLLF